MANDPKHPELHVYEEQRNDFIDTAMGFGVFFAVLLVISIAATAVTMLMR